MNNPLLRPAICHGGTVPPWGPYRLTGHDQGTIKVLPVEGHKVPPFWMCKIYDPQLPTRNTRRDYTSGQIIATSHDLTPNGGLVREMPLFQLISGKPRLVKYYNLASRNTLFMIIYVLTYSPRVHVWYIYLHVADFYDKCRLIYHTWILWDLNIYTIKSRKLHLPHRSLPNGQG